MLSQGKWSTILQYLEERFPQVARDEWLRRISQRAVVDEHGEAVTEARAHEPGLTIFYYRTIPNESPIPFGASVLFQDEHLVVADKPHFLPVMPAGRFLQETLLVRLKRKLGIDALVPIHRIDSATAGVVLFSVDPKTRDTYQSLFRDRAVEKTYEAIASFNEALRLPMVYESRLVQDEHFMRMREVEGEPNSQTRIELIELIEQLEPHRGCGESAPRSLARYRLSPTTGRKHQLRVQCASLGIPILNDSMYPVLAARRDSSAPADYSKPLQLLARSVAFHDPITGTARRFSSERQLSWAVTPL